MSTLDFVLRQLQAPRVSWRRVDDGPFQVVWVILGGCLMTIRVDLISALSYCGVCFISFCIGVL
jgi:hypothetical protein